LGCWSRQNPSGGFGYEWDAGVKKNTAGGSWVAGVARTRLEVLAMKILSLHCDYIKFKALKPAIKGLTLEKSEEKEVEVKEPLVILTAIEKQDETNKEILQEYLKNILDLKQKIGKVERIVLYPYAHLSSSLSSPDFAKNILVEAEKELKKQKLEVYRAPFGFYKEFELKCKGHPLSELSRNIGTQEVTVGKVELSKKVTDKPLNEKELKNLLAQASNIKVDTSKLKENDHRILGQKLGLFMFNETAPGMPYWLPNGLILYNELIKFWREEHDKRGYKEIASPLMNKSELYKISGHWEHYKDAMFIAHTDENEDYCLKPMNCPNAMIVFKMQPRSYKELPLRLSDTDRLHRFEKSGTLNGLLRVRGFQQDDSHNFITEDMIESEYKEIFKICERFYSIFGLKYSFRLSTRPEGFLGEIETWNKAEAILKKILKESGKKFEVLEGDGAFYGPKVDIDMEDSMGRKWQTGTIQLDFQLPKRFELTYTDKDGKEKTPIVLHRVIYGSLERFIGVLVEHLNGRFPTWLAPIQVKVLSFTERNEKAAKKLFDELKEAGIRCELDTENGPVQGRFRDAELQKIPIIIMIGDKEEAAKTLAVRRDGKVKFGVKKEDFLKELLEEIKERK
jgi:threonyl-tRNA synthetase